MYRSGKVSLLFHEGTGVEAVNVARAEWEQVPSSAGSDEMHSLHLFKNICERDYIPSAFRYHWALAFLK